MIRFAKPCRQFAPSRQMAAPLLLVCALLLACAPDAAVVPAGTSPERTSDTSGTSVRLDPVGDPAADPRAAPQIDAAIELHHWQSIAAIKAGDVPSALHQVRHIIDVVTGEHRRAMENVAEFLYAGDLHRAEHTIEQMLGGRATSDLSPRQMHLQLALFSLDNGDAEEAAHHITHADLSLQSAYVAADGGLAVAPDVAEALRALLSAAIDADLSETECWGATSSTEPAALRVVVALDSDWIAHHGANAFSAGEARVAEAGRILGEVGTTLEIVDMFEWSASPATDRSGLRQRLADDFPRSADADLTILLTAQDLLGGSDGTYLSERRVAVVWHHHTLHSSDSLVLVHEVGHHLGMLHRRGTYMQAGAFPLATVWSDCQLERRQTPGWRD